MSNTPSTTVDVSNRKVISTTRPSSNYSYLGRDKEGFHHHFDKAMNTIYVTSNRAERLRPVNAEGNWVHICGDVDHVEHLRQYDDRGLTDWIAYVDAVRGWQHPSETQPSSPRIKRSATSDNPVIRITLELEHPITPSDLERAYCELLEQVDR